MKLVKSRNHSILTVALSITLFICVGNGPAFAQTLWSFQPPVDARIDAGALLVDISAPNFVVLGVYATPTSAGVPAEGTYAVALDSLSGGILWAAPLDTGASDYVLSVQALADQSIPADNVEEALIAVRKIPTSASPASIEYFVLDGSVGSILTTREETTDGGVPGPALFEPIRGDFDGDGSDNNFLYRKDHHVDPADGAGIVEAVK